MNAKTPTTGETTVLPFTHLGTGALEPVLAAQGREWRERLGWDLAEITEFIAAAHAARTLRGAAVLVGGRPIGYGFFTLEVDRCLIGDVYVDAAQRTPETSAALVSGVLRQVQRSRTRKRVESQSIMFDAAGAGEAFAEQGFARHERSYLAAPLAGEIGAFAAEHSRIRVRPWRDEDFGPAAETIYRAYQGTVDARMNCQYRTSEGCADLLDALTDSPWCGRFEPDLTQVAVDRETGRSCGVAVVSAISPETAHLGQVSVLPAYQGSGVGRTMILAALAAARRAGFAEATLAVTRENRAAARLYARLGFEPRVDFPVFTREATPR